MNKQEKIDKIYKEIANKELSFGCKYKFHNDIIKTVTRQNWIMKHQIIENIVYIWEFPVKIIKWHPVMIGDALDWWYKKSMSVPMKSKSIFMAEVEFKKLNNLSFKVVKEILKLYKEFRKPIEEQPEKCIDYIFNLLAQW